MKTRTFITHLMVLVFIAIGTLSALADDAANQQQQQQAGSWGSWLWGMLWYYVPLFLCVGLMLFFVTRLPHVRRQVRYMARQEQHMDRIEALMERLVTVLEQKNKTDT